MKKKGRKGCGSHFNNKEERERKGENNDNRASNKKNGKGIWKNKKGTKEMKLRKA
jgi:hypothetical protein